MGKFNLKDLKNKKFHFIGIGGISMSALAFLLNSNGFYVQGSDEVEGEEVKKLTEKNIKVFIGHDENNVYGVDIVVVSSAIHEDNPEYQFAIKNGLQILGRAELLGMIASGYEKVIAIAGSHGKTTATAMIGEVFNQAGLNPTLHLGGVLKSIGANYLIGGNEFFITENCEYKDNFLHVEPDISVILNIDRDHLDYFGDLNGVKRSFFRYAQNTKNGGINVVCGDDKNSKELFGFENSIKFGLGSKNQIHAKNIVEYRAGFYSFDVIFEKCCLGNFKLNVVGRHNILNALACVFVCIVSGIGFEIIKNGIEKFSGVKRRCEWVGKVNGADVFHDYAHHPKQIEKMIKVATSCKSKNGKVLVVFEPHTYSRTKYLLKDFAKSFCGSDMVILAPVYSAREQESDGLSSKDLLLETKKYVKISLEIDKYNEIEKMIKNVAKKGDVVMILGAGTIEKLSKLLVT